MSISSLHLDAFLSVSQEKSFSAAANKLNITQSALSQRVSNLEKTIGHTVFIRDPAGILLTAVGHQLLQYCLQKQALENDFISNLTVKNKKQLNGLVKIGAFSSIAESIVIPITANIIEKQPQLEIHVFSRELSELSALLATGTADFIFLNSPCDKIHLENHLVGYEKYVMVESKKGCFRKNTYLDHDENDTTTAEFFHQQKQETQGVKISYVDNINLIIAGVSAGIGRAIIPLHIAKKTKNMSVIKGYKTLKKPVYLVRHKHAYYSESQKYIFQCFYNAFKEYLAN